MSDDEGGVLTPKEAVEAAVASWKSAYKTSIHETESKDAGAATFVVICSKPTQTRPVPDCVANVHVRVDDVGEGGSSVLTYQGACVALPVAHASTHAYRCMCLRCDAVENQTHRYPANDHFPTVVDKLLDAVIEQKRAQKTFIDVRAPFDRSRLPVAYVGE